MFGPFVIGYPVSVSGMITLPVSSSVYQSMVANIQQIHTNSDGTLCITPMQVQKAVPFSQNNNVSLHHAPGTNQLSNNNNSTTNNTNLLQLCRALNNNIQFNNGSFNNVNMTNGMPEIKIEKDTKFIPDSPDVNDKTSVQ